MAVHVQRVKDSAAYVSGNATHVKINFEGDRKRMLS